MQRGVGLLAGRGVGGFGVLSGQAERRRSAVLKVAPAVRAARSSWADASTMPAS
ncbi:Uncharacterised protein [Bordetella pertussis]|nr:Uncharacterised protein [Bordetella pertussis]